MFLWPVPYIIAAGKGPTLIKSLRPHAEALDNRSCHARAKYPSQLSGDGVLTRWYDLFLLSSKTESASSVAGFGRQKTCPERHQFLLVL